MPSPQGGRLERVQAGMHSQVGHPQRSVHCRAAHAHPLLHLAAWEQRAGEGVGAPGQPGRVVVIERWVDMLEGSRILQGTLERQQRHLCVTCGSAHELACSCRKCAACVASVLHVSCMMPCSCHALLTVCLQVARCARRSRS